MYTIKPGRIIATCVAASISAVPALAQQEAGSRSQPPKLERLDEGEEPPVTARTPDQRANLVEKRIRGGRVTEIEVNRGNNTYYLRPNTQSGSAVPGDLESNRMRAPQWRIGEFDLRRPEEKKKATEAAATTPPPPEPVAPPGK